MKKSIIYLFVLCITIFFNVVPSKAQDVHMGFAFGPAYHYINSQNASIGSSILFNRDLNPILTYSLNAHISVQTSRFGFTIEPGYIKKGGRSGDFRKNGWSIQYNFHYVQLPLLFDIHINRRFYFSVGGDFSYLLPFGSTAQTSGVESSSSFYDIAAIGSISYNLTPHLDLCLRYNYGFRSQPPLHIPLTHISSYTIGGGKNMHGQLLLRVKFGVSSKKEELNQN